MNRSIQLAFSVAIAIPILAMAQSTEAPPTAPAQGEEKRPAPAVPAPVPMPVPVPVPTLPPVAPPLPIPVPVVPVVPVPVVPVMPIPSLPPVPGPSVPVPPERPVNPRPNRPSPPGAKEKPSEPKETAPAPALPTLPAKEADPKPTTEPPALVPGMKQPPASPAETHGRPTPPASATGDRPLPGRKPNDRKGPRMNPPQVPPADPSVPAPAEPKVTERPVAQKPPSKETAKVLEDQGKRDRQADAQQARKIEDKDDAKRLLMSILGGGAIGIGAGDRSNQPPLGDRDRDRPGDRPGDRFSDRPGARPGDLPGDRSRRGYRPSFEEVGRTQQERERNVGSMVQRFQGHAPQTPPPHGIPQRDRRSFETSQTQRHTQFYQGNRRVIRYSSMQEIPPVIVASQRLNRVQVTPLSQSAYTAPPQGAPQGQFYNEVPQSYTADNAYAVSYGVDPDSAISTNDILFRQGSTDFADAYSYDLVIDVAEAMNADALLKETFVIEGHASAEGDYAQNLLLSQERAERISRELVRHGVSPERLMPVGYGETEAAHPANSGEGERRLDRRVMVFRMR